VNRKVSITRSRTDDRYTDHEAGGRGNAAGADPGAPDEDGAVDGGPTELHRGEGTEQQSTGAAGGNGKTQINRDGALQVTVESATNTTGRFRVGKAC